MLAFPKEEGRMDNRLNKIRKEMNHLREEMLRAEADMHDRIARGQDSSEAAVRVLEMRMHLAAKAAEWKALGGLAILPTVEERLKEKREPLARPRLYVVPIRKAPVSAKAPPPKAKKRRLAARA
jgi:chorismate mutase